MCLQCAAVRPWTAVKFEVNLAGPSFGILPVSLLLVMRYVGGQNVLLIICGLGFEAHHVLIP